MKVLKVFGKIIAVIICIVYFFGLFGIMTALFASNLLSKEYYSDIIESMDFESMKLSDFGDLFEDSGLDENMTLEEAFVEYFTQDEVEKEKALAIVNNEEIRELVGGFFGEVMDYFLGGQKPTVTRDEVKSLLTNPDFVAAAGEPKEEDIDEIYNSIIEFIEELDEVGGNFNGSTKRDTVSEIDFR